MSRSHIWPHHGCSQNCLSVSKIAKSTSLSETEKGETMYIDCTDLEGSSCCTIPVLWCLKFYSFTCCGKKTGGQTAGELETLTEQILELI